MANIQTHATMETKKSKEDKTAYKTAVTFDWTGVSEEQLRGLAEKHLKVLLQSQFRAGANDTPPVAIPKQYTCKVAEIGTRGNGMSQDSMLEILAAAAKSDPKKAAEIKRALGL